MRTRELAVFGAVEVTPVLCADERGSFHEWFRADVLATALDGRFPGAADSVAQANSSVSRAGTIRGIHFSRRPPGQEKYVTCLAGAVLDVVVDLREDSPTFGCWDSVVLDDVDHRSVYIPAGVGHGFMALADGSLVTYLCSTTYDPTDDHGISPLDPALGIRWPDRDREDRPIEPLLSSRDRGAPPFAEARALGLLPRGRTVTRPGGRALGR